MSFSSSLKTAADASLGSAGVASEAARPLTAVVGTPGHTGGTLPETGSFCKIDADNVYISAIKKCDDDDSIVIRLCEIEGSDADTVVSWFTPIVSAQHTNIIEEEGSEIGCTGKNPPGGFEGGSACR